MVHSKVQWQVSEMSPSIASRSNALSCTVGLLGVQVIEVGDTVNANDEGLAVEHEILAADPYAASTIHCWSSRCG